MDNNKNKIMKTKSTKERLFEVMGKLDKTFTSKPNINNNEQAIIDDILSINEDINNIVNKVIEYGKKGLLTATIILAVALSSEAQQQNKTNNIISVSQRYTSPDQENLVYTFMIGIATELSTQFMKNGDIDNAGALIEISKYYENLRDNVVPHELSALAKSNALMLIKRFKDVDKQTIFKYIEIGKNIHHVIK